ncbi:MAG: carbohydrate ABC transporter permease [Oscillospiraceae bacterium]|nr:carbohydrate ABC transporter permease [Oscillospiraceae bacterium]
MDVIILAFLFVFFLLILYPFYNSVLVSLVSQSDYIQERFMLFPKRITLESYFIVFMNGSIFDGMRVTTLVTLIGTAYNMFLTTTLAYVFTKSFFGKKFFLTMIIFTMYFSGGLIPFYLLIRDLGLIDNIFSMILPAGVSIMYMTVIRKQFESLPAELEESAKIDGASEMTILFRIMLPLSLPIIVTFALYYGVERWNEWYNGMLFIRTFDRRPLQLVLRGIIQTTGNQLYTSDLAMYDIQPFSDGIKMACIVVTMTPVIAVYPFLQKYFVSGLTLGAVKG